jgi:NAD(P)-dependent dehydrogenase (short-subunit alcohol dehydrogenase family)
VPSHITCRLNSLTYSPAFMVTAASRGIGEAIVRELMRRGARVLGVARNPDASSAPPPEGTAGSCHYLQGDVTIEADRRGWNVAAPRTNPTHARDQVRFGAAPTRTGQCFSASARPPNSSAE